MNQLLFLFLLIVKLINIYQCFGITNYTQINDTYIINIASEDIEIFEKKLNDILVNIKNEYNMIIIKVLISSILLYITFIILFEYKSKKNHFIFDTILLLIVLLGDSIYIFRIHSDYKYGIKSAENAIIYYNITMSRSYNVDPHKSNFSDGKIKINYLGDDIKKYGIHAIFCNVPGTLPSKNANPLSYSLYYGSLCYNYDSQRRFLDPEVYNYVGDEESQNYRKIQRNKTFNFF